MTKKEPEALYTVQEMAKILACSRAYIYKLIDKGVILPYVHKPHTKFEQSTLDALRMDRASQGHVKLAKVAMLLDRTTNQLLPAVAETIEYTSSGVPMVTKKAAVKIISQEWGV